MVSVVIGSDLIMWFHRSVFLSGSTLEQAVKLSPKLLRLKTVLIFIFMIRFHWLVLQWVLFSVCISSCRNMRSSSLWTCDGSGSSVTCRFSSKLKIISMLVHPGRKPLDLETRPALWFHPRTSGFWPWGFTEPALTTSPDYFKPT